MAACDGIPELCIEVTVDPWDDTKILMRESEKPGVVIETSRANWEAFKGGVKAGNFDGV